MTAPSAVDQTVDPVPSRTLTADIHSKAWAMGLGARARSRNPQVRDHPERLGLRLCPFRSGTPHRVAWMAGWKRVEPGWDERGLTNPDF